jgi:S-adenosylmethionine:tRNA ribosyltransferase-isomerase
VNLSDFDYDLPPELIAQHPAPERAASRLLCLSRDGALSDRFFAGLPGFLAPGDLVVMNDTRVIRARLRGVKDTGGAVEVLVERVTSEHEALAHVRASKTPKPGARLAFAPGVVAQVTGRVGELFSLRFEQPLRVMDVLDRHGEVPLPPYITHTPSGDDEQRYQTVYAREPGAVAAPTAGLHFDEAIFATLAARGVETARVTLHVGAGTFQPVRGDDIASHVMHAEWCRVPPETVASIERTRAHGGRIVAVGTTTLRSLESAALDGALKPLEGETRLFVKPGFRFHVVDCLVTNFHLPKSTLMMLVSAFAGIEPIRRAYAHAVAERYRFFSYGDAMLIERAAPEARGRDK